MSWIDKAVKEIGESLMRSEGGFWPHRIKEIIERHVAAPQPPEKAGAARKFTFEDFCEPCITTQHCAINGGCLAEEQPTPPPQGPQPRKGDCIDCYIDEPCSKHDVSTDPPEAPQGPHSL